MTKSKHLSPLEELEHLLGGSARETPQNAPNGTRTTQPVKLLPEIFPNSFSNLNVATNPFKAEHDVSPFEAIPPLLEKALNMPLRFTPYERIMVRRICSEGIPPTTKK